jgi:uncharacterized protein YndB with AHSA1/START domain
LLFLTYNKTVTDQLKYMAAQKWASFTLITNIDTDDVRSIFEAWATPAGMEKWFLRKADFYTITKRLRLPQELIKKEDTYKWLWYGYSDEAAESGEVLATNEIDLLKFTFTGGSIVTIAIESRKGFTVVKLTQENIPEENDLDKNLYVQCQIGWTFYLANLKSIIEGGVDLRDKRVIK